ncbi:uncharacterized protein KY384_002933 [Bacidia gigantensis]|uniref:uncharacterized protein n=1 Tax=Bacidia gigantensis TaxID=2732470 RepID=UPI001D047A66|nr:uncharacterized protein KY384_002933 [Bacidia gigantensis]KAG8531305.1 hypothetical protein KY384_002933 [Bacidia gigantensis]
MDPNVDPHPDSVVGLDNAKAEIALAANALNDPNRFLPYKPWRTFLLHGVIGSGKKLFAQSFSPKYDVRIIHASIVTVNVGHVSGLFAWYTALPESRVIILNDVEQMLGVGSTLVVHPTAKSELLAAINCFRDVLVIGITRSPWLLDEAVLRHFDRHLHIHLPNHPNRVQMVCQKISPFTHEIHEADVWDMMQHFEDISGSMIDDAIRGVLMYKYQEARGATHFRKVEGQGGKLWACNEEDLGSEKYNYTQGPWRVSLNPITIADLTDFLRLIVRGSSPLKEAEEKHERWNAKPFQGEETGESLKAASQSADEIFHVQF